MSLPSSRHDLGPWQRGILLADQLDPGGVAYHMGFTLHLGMATNPCRLWTACAALIARFPELRTTLHPSRRHLILEAAPEPDFQHTSVTGVDDLAKRCKAEMGRPFDLTGAGPIRFRAFTLTGGDLVLAVIVHHAMFDERSKDIVVDELRRLLAGGGELAGARAPIGLATADSAAFSGSPLAGRPLPELILPSPRRITEMASSAGDEVRFSLDPEPVRALAKHLGGTPFEIYLSALAVVLRRYGNRQPLVTVIGSTRTAAEDTTVGCYVNSMPVLLPDLDDPTFTEVVAAARDSLAAAYELRRVPFADLVEAIEPWRAPRVGALFQVSLTYASSQSSNDLHDLPTRGAKAPLLIGIRSGTVDRVRIEYATDLFDRPAAQRIAGHLAAVLRTAAASPGTRVSQIDLLGAEEAARLLGGYDQPAHDPPAGLLWDRFAAWAHRTPDAVAVVAGDESITYGELAARANGLARHLRDEGIGPGTLVAVHVDRGADMVVALLAVLAAGAAYVPLDPDFPRERLRFMLADSGAAVLVTQDSRAAGWDIRVVRIDADAALWAGRATAPLDGRPGPVDLAYVIYTSGSTGTPKGVMIEHGPVANMLDHFVDALRLSPGHVWVAVTTPSFDIACLELFGPLVAGATVVVAPASAAADPVRLADLLTSCRATVLQATPTAWRLLVDGGGTWPEGLTALCGGEALPADLAAAVAARCRMLWNVYGPTETTVWSTSWNVDPGVDPPLIGRPIRNTTCYVLDEHGAPVPEWIPGELHIGGAGLARGYLGRPELTGQRFVTDRLGGKRLFRTGDLVRRRDDGDLEYLGRLDHQVKIRGHRVECGDVEVALTAHPAVAEAVVVARPDSSGAEDILVAYTVGTGTDEVLRGHLRGLLPHWMIPAAFVALDHLPRTPNGKTDRAALPAPVAERRAIRETTPPRTPAEETLAAVWRDVLTLDRVGVDDDFFELGGNSLRAVRVVNGLYDRLGVEVPLRLVFAHPTLAGLAARLPAGGPPAMALTGRLRDSMLALSFAQERLWILERMYPGSPAYVIPLRFRLAGQLDCGALDRALTAIIARHEPLRTRFAVRDGRPHQVIDEATPVVVAITDLGRAGRDEAYARVRELATADAAVPFDLTTGPVFRARLVRMAADEHLLLLNVHHIAFDGWSIGVLTHELGVLYSGGSLPPLGLGYADYAVWQRDRHDTGHLAYWRERLAELPMLDLPLDRPRPPVQSHHGAAYPVTIPARLSAGLRALAAEEGATLYMALLAGFQLLLGRYAGRTDIAVGSPVTDRRRPELEPLIGVFLNLLVLRTDTSGSPSFRELLGRVREVTLAAWGHQNVPFEQLVAELSVERDLSHHPLVQAVFTLNAPFEPPRMAGLRVEPFRTETVATRFDLELELTDEGTAVAGSFVYNRDLFLPATVERIASQLGSLLEAAVRQPDTPVDRLHTLSAADRRKILVEWNDTAVERRPAADVAALFERQAARSPEAVALVAGPDTLTYAELNRCANRLAHRLRAAGVRAGAVVAVNVDRSPEMVVALLAVLKVGAAYLPLSPEHPASRRRFVVADSAATIVLTREPAAESWPVPVLVLDGDAGLPETDPPRSTSPDDLAYVIYTSGSTGTPKGVEIPHRGFVNRLDWMQAEYHLTPTDRVLQKTPMTFDVAGWEVFWPLVTGSTLVLAAAGRHGDPGHLLRLMNERTVTVAHFVPSMLHAFLTAVDAGPPPSLRLVVCSGEALLPALAERVAAWAPGAELHNLYGPTEASIDVSFWRFEPRPDACIPIGRPIHNTQLYVLDEYREPVPVGVPGELYIAGDGLARGYRNRPALTAERFVANPFGEQGSRLYRTGDRARYLDDGTIDYLGRLDQQVKIRGIRIELGEIEATLLARPEVAAAAAAVRPDGRLVAYVVPAGEEEAIAGLRDALAEFLPAAMIPSVVLPLAGLPLTSTGKLDRVALPAPPDTYTVSPEHVEPRTHVERVLAGIWTRLLGIRLVGVHDNFFHLGGDSLIAIHIVASARSAGIAVTVRQFFAHQTIAALAAVAGTAIAAEEGPARTSVALNPIQHWFLEQDPADAHHFNQAFVFEVPPDLDDDRLEAALHTVAARHEALRLRFAHDAGTWRASIAPAEASHLLLRQPAEITQTSLDLSEGPLLRAARLKQPERLLLVVHHLAVDAVSWRVIVEDLVTAYRNAADLPPASTPFQEWAHRLTAYASGSDVLAERPHWTATAAAAWPLPQDGPGSSSTMASAEEVRAELAPDLTNDLLTRVPSAYHTRIDDVLLCALADVLTEWSGREDVVVDLEGHGREDLFDGVDLSRTVGWFTSLFPVRLVPDRRGGTGDALIAVKEQLRAVPGRGLGFGCLRYLHPDPEVRAGFAAAGAAPIRFNYVGRWEDSMRAGRPLLRRVDEVAGATTAATMARPYPLDVVAVITGDRLRIGWEYSAELHRRDTIERLAARYVARLREIVEHCAGAAGTRHTPSDFPLWQLLRPKPS